LRKSGGREKGGGPERLSQKPQTEMEKGEGRISFAGRLIWGGY